MWIYIAHCHKISNALTLRSSQLTWTELLSSTPTIAMYYYYSGPKLIFISQFYAV